MKNLGNNQYQLISLPTAAQLAPIHNILVEDFDRDGHLDALLIGNDYSGEKNNGWQDAFNGLLLQGDGQGNFLPISTARSGFLVAGDGRDMVLWRDNKGKVSVVVGQNNAPLQNFDF